MAKMLCTKCRHCLKLSGDVVDCEEAGGEVKAVMRKDVDRGRYDNCPIKAGINTPRMPSQLHMLHLLVRLFGRSKDGEILSRPERLSPDEIKSLEDQVKENTWYPIAIAA